MAIAIGKSTKSNRHPRLPGKWLKLVELVLFCMIQTNLLMGNCSWLSSATRVRTRGFGWAHFYTDKNVYRKSHCIHPYHFCVRIGWRLLFGLILVLQKVPRSLVHMAFMFSVPKPGKLSGVILSCLGLVLTLFLRTFIDSFMRFCDCIPLLCDCGMLR